ncbi:MAG TPA: hypothetical protein VK212_09050 [Lentimicrobium sp.]|nr:hypothetical protein [Lentimicrobium sp.]
MRTITLVVIFILAGLKAMPQDNTTQIPIETEFKNGLIIFTLPSPYSSPEFRPMAIPRFVTTLRTLKVYPNTLSRVQLLEELQRRLSVTKEGSDNTEALDYLKNIALFIYLSNNNVTNLPSQARTNLNRWSKANISFKEELKLVREYLRMADAMKV